MADRESDGCWRCARCDVTASWLPGHEQARPSAWIEDNGLLYCLSCRREMAAELGVSEAPEEANAQRRAQLRAGAMVEFELKRDPDRSDGEIARAVRSSVPAVQKARKRIG